MRIRYAIFLSICALCPAQQSEEELVKKCGSEIKWLGNLDKGYETAKEKKRLILWYVPRVAGSHMDRPAELDLYMKTGPFTNPETVSLINRKFVPVNMESKGQLDIKAYDFLEPGLVFATPDKKVVHKIPTIRTINDDFFYNQLILVLQKNAEYNDPSEETTKAQDSKTDPISLARENAKDGELSKAKKILQDFLNSSAKPEEQAIANYEIAMIFRLERNSNEALAKIKSSRELTKDKKLLGDLYVEEGLVFLKTGKLNEAKSAFQVVSKEYKDSERHAEALYYLGAIAFITCDETTAREIWKSLANDKQDTRWKYKAAANIIKSKISKYASVKPGRGYYDDGTIGESALAKCYEEICWLNEMHYKTLTEGTAWKRDKEEIDDIIKLAVRFLLNSRRSETLWDDTRYVFTGKATLPNVQMAISALCATAILEHREVNPKAIDEAIAKAKVYLMDESKMARGKDQEVYADAYRLMFFSKLLPKLTDAGEKEKTKAFVIELVKQLEKLQRKGGLWHHEYTNPFVSATVILSLQLAKEAGLEVPQKIVDEAAKGIGAARGKSGTFSYKGKGGGSLPECAGRMPLCEMALYFCGKSDLGSIETAIDAYFKNISAHLKTRRVDDHSLHNIGGFFFFHDFYPATEAAKLLKDEPRKKLYKQFLDVLLSISEIDGAFIDSHELGRCFGTAMALLSLRNCASK